MKIVITLLFLLIPTQVFAILSHENRKILFKTADLFEKTLVGLGKGDSDLQLPENKNFAIEKQLGVVRTLWKKYKPFIQMTIIKITLRRSNKISRKSLKKVPTLNLSLLKEMDKTVKMFENLTHPL